MKHSFLIFIIVFVSHSLFGQIEDTQYSRRSVEVRIGYSFNRINDQRLSAITKSSRALQYALVLAKETEVSRQEWNIGFIKNFSPRDVHFLDYGYTKFNFDYSYQRRFGDHWIGGFIDFPTLLTFPVSKTSHFTNSPISYTIVAGMGPKATRSFSVNDQMDITSSVQANLLSYVIRPAHGHPYPDKFLQSDVFTPTREGMAWPMVKSGKIRGPHEYFSFKIKLGFSYLINDHIQSSIYYSVDHLSHHVGKSNQWTSHDIAMGVSYSY